MATGSSTSSAGASTASARSDGQSIDRALGEAERVGLEQGVIHGADVVLVGRRAERTVGQSPERDQIADPQRPVHRWILRQIGERSSSVAAEDARAVPHDFAVVLGEAAERFQ
jgi:hypothetical protein